MSRFIRLRSLSIVTGVVCGIFPVLQAYGKDAGASLREGARSSFGGAQAARFRQVLIGVETMLATALLASAGMLLHSFLKVMGTDRGYEVERVLAVELTPTGERYAAAEARSGFYRDLTASIRGLPGVLAVGMISDLPAAGDAGFRRKVFDESDTDLARVVMQRPSGLLRAITPGYLAASGAALRAGRNFQGHETEPVALISQSLVRQLWPGELPERVLGRRFRHGTISGPPITVVGIVDDIRTGALNEDQYPQIYIPHEQRPSGRMFVIVKTAGQDGGESSSLAAAVRSEIRKLDATLPVPAMRTMREIVSEAVAERRFQMQLITAFAVLALILGSIGVHGVVSYSVTCRTRDIGLRVALGAMRGDVMRWVFASGLRPVLFGLACGLAAAIAIARSLRSLLYEVTPTDPWTLGGVAGLLLLTSILACYLPARRAASLDPLVSLRHQ